MFGDVQNWGHDGRQREEQRRRQNQEFLAGLRQQIESQKLRKRRDRFEPTAVDPGRVVQRNPALPEDFAPPPRPPPSVPS